MLYTITFITDLGFITEFYYFYERDVGRYINTNLIQYYFDNISQHIIS